jgi:hypothetical protein
MGAASVTGIRTLKQAYGYSLYYCLENLQEMSTSFGHI